jgi:hypothetical protein
MSLAIVELNDQNLLIQTDQGLLHCEPGFAQLHSTGIETGERARAAAWQQPQHSYNQYWRQLNQLPLPSKQKWARHHGDIAFAQLKQLVEYAGSPQRLILAVPGSCSDDQLSLLLGLTSAIPVQVTAVIDSALATCATETQPTVLVELQLHQTVVSLIDCSAGSLSLSQQETIPDLGIMQLHNAAARHISDRLVQDYRYDPMHNSEGEQAIYNQLPQWLMQLGWEDKLNISLPSPQGDLKLVLHKHQLTSLFEQRLNSLSAILDRHSSAKLCFSHSASLIPAMLPQFADATVKAQSSAIDNCLGLQQQLCAEELHRIKELEQDGLDSQTGPTQLQTHQASHVLYKNQAYPLHQPLSLHLKDGKLSLTSCIDNQAECVLVVENQQLKILHQQDDLEVQLPSSCEPGKQLIVSGQKLRLIEVSNG